MRRNDQGYIVVETIGAFVPFVLLVISILSLVNLVAVQARVHYAITQVAETLSVYSYTLDVTGLSGKLRGIAGQADKAKAEVDTFQSNFDTVVQGIQALSGETVQTGAAGLYSQAERLVEDPKAMLQQFLSFGTEKLGDLALGHMLQGMAGRYLANGDLSADEYLKRSQVKDGLKGLDFGHSGAFALDGSRLLDADGDVVVTVRYEIQYTFGMLPLPFQPTLKVTQQARTKAWLGGNGEGYVHEGG